jgi:hypothetical protein
LESTYIASLAQLASLPGKKWATEFIKRVRTVAEKDTTYQKAVKEVEMA